MIDTGTLRTFDTGATRDTAEGKPDYEGCLSPYAIEAYGAYMDQNRKQSDGSLRDIDDWQRGIPRAVYMKSLWRHLIAAWKAHRTHDSPDVLEEALCGIMFNAMGYLHELKSHKENDHA